MKNLVKDYIQDETIKLNSKKERLHWLKSNYRRFRKLIKSKRNIEITDWHDFSNGAGFLDIQVKLPSRLKDICYYVKDFFRYIWEKFILRNKWVDPFVISIKDCVTPQFRWTFTILNKSSLVENDISDLLYGLLYKQLRRAFGGRYYEKFDEFEKDPKSLFDFIKNNPDKIFEDGAVITYDNIYTNEEWLTKEHAIKYSRMWLNKFYPELRNREIVFVDPEVHVINVSL
jgi:hypothetical protein